MELFDTPVLLIIFNRPDETRKVFDQLAKIKPDKLFIAADGPRKSNDSDIILCEESRKVIEKINWDCKLQTRFLEENQGCGRAVSSAISWFFSNVEEGIILEDDCLPVLTFFGYCQELLKKYRFNNRIFHINGNSFQDFNSQQKASYFFSYYPHIWGWASWRRAWKHYDYELSSLNDSIEKGKLEHVFHSDGERKLNLKLFEKMQNKEIDTWDYQWAYSIWKEGGMVITPWLNMVENIGIQEHSTHLFLKDRYRDGLKAGSMVFPLVHPSIEINTLADKRTYDKLYSHSLKRGLRIFRENKFKDIFRYLVQRTANKTKGMPSLLGGMASLGGWQASVERGRDVLAGSSIIVCGIVRDCDKQLKKNIEVVNSLCSLCKSYNVIMVENDSVDNTKQILHNWSKNDKNIHVISGDYGEKTIPHKNSVEGNPMFSAHRIGKMAKYRNEYLKYIYEKKIQADYLIVIDMDVSKIELSGIFNSFGLPINWDVITANGYSLSPQFKKRYHDTYALTEWEMKDAPQTEKMIYKDNYKKYSGLDKGLPPIKIFSAFGGISIYKASLFNETYYELIENDDSRVKVRCEHYSLFKQFSEKGYDQFYINPAMEVKYQTVSLKIIGKTLTRFLSKK